ncbi:MAG: glycosyltransferase, partial [Candidatus Saccharimonadales bacterium]
MKVAIVCDWLTGVGGAERVVLELHKMYPAAPIYTSQYSPSKIDWFKGADVRTGWLQKLPAGLKKFLPVLRAWYFSRLDLGEYDLVISSSGAEAKAVKTGPKTKHICYMHAPTHYYWSRYNEYMQNPGFGFLDPLARLGLKILVRPMRRWDYKAAQRPDYIIANSNFTKDQIKKYYSRDSIVIPPPVDIERFKILSKSSISRKGFLTAGRQTPYKRIDLAVAACTNLGLPLTVVGNGPDHQRL